MQLTVKSHPLIDTSSFDKYDKFNQIKLALMSDQHQLLSTRQAASLLGVSVRTIQLWVEQGLLSAWKTPGGHRRIVQQSLLSLLNKRQGLQPLAHLLCVNLDADFFKLLQVLCQQWQQQHAPHAPAAEAEATHGMTCFHCSSTEIPLSLYAS